MEADDVPTRTLVNYQSEKDNKPRNAVPRDGHPTCQMRNDLPPMAIMLMEIWLFEILRRIMIGIRHDYMEVHMACHLDQILP